MYTASPDRHCTERAIKGIRVHPVPDYKTDCALQGFTHGARSTPSPHYRIGRIRKMIVGGMGESVAEVRGWTDI
jgi:hypothetical protein